MWGRPHNRRKPASEGRWRLPAVNWGRILLSLVSTAGVLATVAVVGTLLDRPISQVEIAGSFQRVSPIDIERAVRESVHGTGLVRVDLAAVGAAVRKLPWVDAVSVERSWPRALHVSIVEQVPSARWNEDSLINTRGELFVADARHLPLELPRLSGPDGSAAAVAQRYLAIHGRLLEAGMRITALRLDARGAWELDLDNGVSVRLGRKQIDERFDTFMSTAAKIVAQRATDIAYVDMRYSNGFSIGWRGGAARVHTTEDSAHDV